MGQEILQLATSVSHEKGLEIDDVLSALESALARVVRHERGANWKVRAHIDRGTGDIAYWRCWDIVGELGEEEELQPESQILSDDARAEGRSVGEVIEEPIDGVVLGRIAARLARQFLYQSLREIEANLRRAEFAEKVGEIVSGTVKRLEMGNVYLDVKRFEVLLRKDNMIPGESVAVGMRLRAVVDRVDDGAGGAQVMLSRTSPAFLQKLLAQEVPEVAGGSVQIMGVARDPGSRAKVVVFSHDPSVDPVGACIGMRGVRIQSVTNELHGEKVDVIHWSEDMGKYIINIFSSADVRRVLIDQEKDRIEVVVSDETLSFAIGRAGQNVKLARQLVRKRLEIMGVSDSEKRDSDELQHCVNQLQETLCVDEMMSHLLVLEGYKRIEDFSPENAQSIAAIEGFDADTADELVQRAQQAIKNEVSKKAKESESAMHPDLVVALKEEGLSAIGQALVAGGVKTVEDFAWLSVDELLDLTNGSIDEAVAAHVIMRLRAPFIQE